MSRVNVVHADTYRDLVCSCRATMRVHACENEVIIELYRNYCINIVPKAKSQYRTSLLDNALAALVRALYDLLLWLPLCKVLHYV